MSVVCFLESAIPFILKTSREELLLR